MLTPKILIDSSFLYALSDKTDQYRFQAVAFATEEKRSTRVIPDVVLTEVTYLLKKNVGTHAVLAFLKALEISSFELEPVSKHDAGRAAVIMQQYRQFDFVDCCIMALAERLNITQVCTFDRRDFTIFRPTHCEHLELLP